MIQDPEMSETVNDAESFYGLDEKVLQLIRSSPNLTIKPAKLSSALGISLDEANSELCGLMKAVGSTATFHFESATAANDIDDITKQYHIDKKVMTMVFTFPDDFEQRAKATRRKEDIKTFCMDLMYTGVKIGKVIIAFGLIISLLIVIIAILCALVASLIALTRNRGSRQGGNGSQYISRHIRNILYTLRQLFWCFYVFDRIGGFNDGNARHPFLQEISGTLLMLCSLCYSGPSSIFFWLRLNQLQRRQYNLNRRRRRFGGNGGWGITSRSTQQQQQSQQPIQYQPVRSQHGNEADEYYRGILSCAVEFLFGPSPFHPGPTDFDKWKLREEAILYLSSLSYSSIKNTSNTKDSSVRKPQENDKSIDTTNVGVVSLKDLLPFVDHPPLPSILSSASNDSRQYSESLQIVTHFGGVPVTLIPIEIPATIIANTSSESYHGCNDDDMKSKCFIFPELLSEFTTPTKNNYNYLMKAAYSINDNMWDSFLYSSQQDTSTEQMWDVVNGVFVRTSNGGSSLSRNSVFLMEKMHVLTKMSKHQFLICLLLNTFNLIGMLMILRSIEKGGILEIRSIALYHVIRWLLRFLLQYAKLFFIIPFIRMVILVALNFGVNRRNERRRMLADLLTSPSD
jgi:hypothetical protein